MGRKLNTDILLTDASPCGFWIADSKDGVVYRLDDVKSSSWLLFVSAGGGNMLQLDYDNLSRGIDCGVFKMVGRG